MKINENESIDTRDKANAAIDRMPREYWPFFLAYLRFCVLINVDPEATFMAMGCIAQDMQDMAVFAMDPECEIKGYPQALIDNCMEDCGHNSLSIALSHYGQFLAKESLQRLLSDTIKKAFSQMQDPDEPKDTQGD